MPLQRFFIEHAAVPSPSLAADRAATSTSTHRVFRTSTRLPDGARGGPTPPASVSSGRRLPVPPSGADDGARAQGCARAQPAQAKPAQPPRTGVSSAGAPDRMRFRLQRTPRGGGGSDHDDAAAAGVGVFGVVRSDGGAPAPITRSSRPPPSLRRATSAPRVGTDPIASGEGGGAQSPASRMSNIERILAPRRERRTKSPLERLSASLADADATPLPVFDQLRSSRDLEIRRGSARRNGSVGCFPAAVITLRECGVTLIVVSSSLCVSPTPLVSMLDCSAVLSRERVHVYFNNVA